MTGQVKEDFISRFGEMGVLVRNGKIEFNTGLLDKDEFLTKSQVFYYYDVNGKQQTLMLNPGMLAFTICQVPIIYITADKQKIVVTKKEGLEEEIDGLAIGTSLSRTIFRREDNIKKIQVLINI